MKPIAEIPAPIGAFALAADVAGGSDMVLPFPRIMLFSAHGRLLSKAQSVRSQAFRVALPEKRSEMCK
jgi:hypothetical protein